MKVTHLILAIFSGIFIVSCINTNFNTASDYFRYVNDEKNGFIKVKEYDNVIYKLKYLSPDYLVANEITKNKNLLPAQIDSIYIVYSKSRTFLLIMSTSEKNKGDIMLEGVQSEEEYKQRFELLNFKMGDFIYLKTAKNKYRPALTNLENVYGLSKSRNINLVFSSVELNDDLKESDEYEIIFEDMIFNTGINHFTFKKKDIDKKFNLKFLK